VPEAQDEPDSYVFDFYELLVSGASRIGIWCRICTASTCLHESVAKPAAYVTGGR
jgi:predicted transcriptional regulator